MFGTKLNINMSTIPNGLKTNEETLKLLKAPLKMDLLH